MAFDLSRLRRGERIAGVAGIVLFVDMFLSWYEPHESGLALSWNAWQAFSLVDLVMLVAIVAAVGLAVLTATQRTVALPVTAAVITTALAFLVTLLVAFRVLIDQPGMGVGAPNAAIDNTIWAWVGLLACIGMLYGGYDSMRDEGTSLADAREQARRAFESAAPRQPGAGAETSSPPPGGPPAVAPPPPQPASEAWQGDDETPEASATPAAPESSAAPSSSVSPTSSPTDA